MQLSPELLCNVPTKVHTCLQQWWLTGYRQPSVDKDLWIPYQRRTLRSIRCLSVSLGLACRGPQCLGIGAALSLSPELPDDESAKRRRLCPWVSLAAPATLAVRKRRIDLLPDLSTQG